MTESTKSRWKKAGGVVTARNMAAKAFKSVPHGIDGNTFFSPCIPPEVRNAVPRMHDIDQTVFRRVLEASIQYMRGDSFSDEQFRELQQSLGLDGDGLGILFTGVHSIITAAIRNRTKISIVQSSLLEMNVPDKIARDIVKAVRLSRFSLEDAAVENRIRFPKLDALQWRVDVAISTSALSRVLKPTVMMQICLSDGSLKTFEVPVDQFHNLRYNTARVLRDMQEVQRHPIMRLAFDADKKRFDENKREDKRAEQQK